jgi:hypothetical protein
MDQPNARGKSAEARRKEHKALGGRSIDLTYKAVAYVIKKQHWFFCQCTKEGGDYDMHSNFDWTYAGLTQEDVRKGSHRCHKDLERQCASFCVQQAGPW